jgi:purine-binding chemotaxis protein CheW
MSDDRGQQLLEARARALAKPVEDVRGRDEIRLMAFSLGGERYAIELGHVIEVFRVESLSPLPGAPAPVVGITAWRGELLTVLDLRPVLGQPTQGLDDLRFALALGEERAPIGLLVDGVDEILSVASRRIGPAPEGVAVHREYVRGVMADARVVLDAERLVDTHR